MMIKHLLIPDGNHCCPKPLNRVLAHCITGRRFQRSTVLILQQRLPTVRKQFIVRLHDTQLKNQQEQSCTQYLQACCSSHMAVTQCVCHRPQHLKLLQLLDLQGLCKRTDNTHRPQQRLAGSQRIAWCPVCACSLLLFTGIYI